MAEIKVSDMTFLSSVPDDAKIYIVVPGSSTPYYTTKAALFSFISGIDAVLLLNNQVASDTPIIYPDNGLVRTVFSNGELSLEDTVSSKTILFIDSGIIRYMTGFFNTKRTVVQFEDPTQVNYITIGDESGKMATQEWTNSAINSAVVGLLDDRGNYDASGNLFPSTGGSGTSGAIKKGDLWTISVAGTLGSTAVTTGDVVRALVDSPGQTAANWSVTENNIGYVPENSSNKGTVLGNLTSTTIFPHAKGVVDYVNSLGFITNVISALGYTPIKPLINSKPNVSTTGSEAVVATCRIDNQGTSWALDLFLECTKVGTVSSGSIKVYLNNTADLTGSPTQLAISTSDTNARLVIPLVRKITYSGGVLEYLNSTTNLQNDLNNQTQAKSTTTIDLNTAQARYLVITIQRGGTSGDTVIAGRQIVNLIPVV